MIKAFFASLLFAATTVVAQTTPALTPTPIYNAVRICQEPCTIVSVSDSTAIIFRYAVGTGTGAPVGKYAAKQATPYTVVYTYVKTPGGLTHTLEVPASTLMPVGTVDSKGVFTAQNPGIATVTATVGTVSGSTVITVPPPSPTANSVRICQEPCYITSVSDSTALIYRFALGTGTGAPVAKYALKNAAPYTVVYTYVKTPGGLQHTLSIPAYVMPLVILGVTDSNGVFTPLTDGKISITWPTNNPNFSVALLAAGGVGTNSFSLAGQ
jgi:hypothetical protein